MEIRVLRRRLTDPVRLGVCSRRAPVAPAATGYNRAVRCSTPLILALAAACGSDPVPTDGGPADAFAGAIDAALGADAAPARNPLDGAGAAALLDGNYQFLEGPVWRPADGVLLFSDIPANTIYQLAPPDTVTVFRPDSGNANGLVEDTAGLLLAAEHGNRRVSRTLANGQVVDVATEYMSLSLNSPNDIAVRSDGTIYFTDPPYGIQPQEQELSFNGVFRVAPGGGLTAEWEGAQSSRPNGIALSPDESVLYVADTSGPVRAYDVAGDGTLSGERVFASDVSNGDGICMDRDGNVFVTGAGGVAAFAPDGTRWGTLSVPLQPANCTFGGADGLTMYITARTGLYAATMVIPGL